MAIAHFRRISSASISARRTTGISRARAATTSGLSALTAEEITTTRASPRFSAACPTWMESPSLRKRLTLALAAMSDPWTL